jgi:hypothetical protein
MNHLDDDAELYALGLTEAGRAAEIEAHLAECADCRGRVVAAEAAAASLAATLPPARAARPRAAWWPALASAAAVVFAATAGFEGYTAHASATQLARTDIALSAIASSHFGHTTMISDPGVVAKVLYSRNGAWCYVMVSGAPRGAHVRLGSGAAARDAGTLDDGAPATLFVRDPGRPGHVEVVAGDRVLASGNPVY